VNRIHARLEVDDYLAAQQLHTRWTRRQLGVVAAMLGAGLLLAWASMHERWAFVVACSLLGGAVGGIVAREVARRFVLPWRSRRVFTQQKSLQRPVEFWWDDDALHGSNDRGSNSTPWSDYVKWRQSERIILLYLSDAMFQMVPKRCFDGPAQLAAFLERVETIGRA